MIAIRAGAAIALLAVSGCKADLPRLTDASEPLDATCTGPYADLIVDVFPTTLDASAVLGAPDGLSVALASDDLVTVGFIGLGTVTDAPGVDLRVHATFGTGASGIVRVAAIDRDFRFTGNLNESTTEFDLQVPDVNAAAYVRIIAVAGPLSIDAIEATHDTCP